MRLLTVVLALAVTVGAWTPPRAFAENPDASADTAVLPDPSVKTGVLPNGLRYAIKRNGTPTGGVSFRLTIHAGAFDEADPERGVAHFVEHVAFSAGQSWYKSGDEARFAAAGVSMGRDQDAQTSIDRTTYYLDLPKAGADSQELALRWLRGVAMETTFPSSTVERERQIILQELVERTTAVTDLDRNLNAFFTPGLRSETEDVGGDADQVSRLTAEQLKTFYERWYRPDNAVLVIVGDIAPEAIESQIRQSFGDWVAVGSPPPRPPRVMPDLHRATDFISLSNAASPDTLKVCSVTSAAIDEPDTIVQRRRILLTRIWQSIFDQRMIDLANQPNSPLITAKASREEGLEDVKSCVDAFVAPGQRDKALALLKAELGRLRTTDPTEDELERAVDILRASERGALKGADTRDSGDLAAEIANDQLDHLVFAAPY